MPARYEVTGVRIVAIMRLVSTGSAIELIENALLAFVFAGVAWNVAAGYDLVPEAVVPAGVVLTLTLLFALFSFDTLRRRRTIEEPR